MATPHKQVYDVLNAVVKEALGKTDISVTDNTGIISLGDYVLSSQETTNVFAAGLVDLIGKTVIASRSYEPKFKGIQRDNFDYGAVLRKISFKLKEVSTDESIELENGVAVDPFVVSKPEIVQKLFQSRNNYELAVTMQDLWLKTAFRGADEMGSFISGISTAMRNSLALDQENMNRNCVCNYIGELYGTTREIKLLTEFNKLFPAVEPGQALTATGALYNEKFLRYASMRMKKYSELLTDMSVLYNDGSITRVTPRDKQRVYLHTDFELAMETFVLPDAYHEFYLKAGDHELVNFWQAAQKPMQIEIKKASPTHAPVSGKNIVAVMADVDAFGSFRDKMRTTSAYNAKGEYTNYFFKNESGFFNDLSENGVIFTLN